MDSRSRKQRQNDKKELAKVAAVTKKSDSGDLDAPQKKPLELLTHWDRTNCFFPCLINGKPHHAVRKNNKNIQKVVNNLLWKRLEEIQAERSRSEHERLMHRKNAVEPCDALGINKKCHA